MRQLLKPFGAFAFWSFGFVSDLDIGISDLKRGTYKKPHVETQGFEIKYS